MIVPFQPKFLPCMQIINDEEYESKWPEGIYLIKVFLRFAVEGFYILKGNEIVRLMVGKEFRNKGVGSKLLKDIDKKILEITINEEDEQALNWLQKKGFLGVGLKSRYYGKRDGYVLRRELC